MAQDVLPPCHAACPALTDTREYVRAVADGRYEDALDILLAANPMSAVCGRICHHPCEEACRRSSVDSPVSLRAIKRFVTDATREYRSHRVPGRAPSSGRKVAVVGSGPAGLAAALDLSLSGVDVVVYERDERPGGMLGATIPRYRLPYEVVEEDIDDIRRAGVEIKTGVEIGTDIGLQDLCRDYDAVVLALGLAESRSLAVPGVDLDGVHLAIDFLRRARAGGMERLNGSVLVVGGGNVAMDVARTAVRLGAEDVTAVALESVDEMPAHKWEIDEAHEEGVKIINSYGPVEFTGDGRVAEAVFRRCTRVFDDGGRFAPEYDDADRISLPADTVVLAIGQSADTVAIKGAGIEESAPGRIKAGPGARTSADGVFLAGEVMTGPGSAVEAVASGHRTAAAVLEYLGVPPAPLVHVMPSSPAVPDIEDIPEDVRGRMSRIARVSSPMRSPAARAASFEEVEGTLSEAEARKEAARCVACGLGAEVDPDKCVGCYTCVRICPYGVATVGHTAAEAPAEACLTCGLCAAECPAAAISLQRFGRGLVHERLARALELNPGARVAVLLCQNALASRRFLTSQQAGNGPPAAIVPLPCVERLAAVDIMAPFESGAEKVFLVHCGDACVYPEGRGRFEQTVSRAAALLKAAGLRDDALNVWFGRIESEQDLERIYADSTRVGPREAADR
ncbi:MAG: FAD-dependent oxidoreductase [Planctomycetes bacterium]|nr:FAD-dependent oxidoreductase [Planctomycetota bacterium]